MAQDEEAVDSARQEVQQAAKRGGAKIRVQEAWRRFANCNEAVRHFLYVQCRCVGEGHEFDRTLEQDLEYARKDAIRAVGDAEIVDQLGTCMKMKMEGCYLNRYSDRKSPPALLWTLINRPNAYAHRLWEESKQKFYDELEPKFGRERADNIWEVINRSAWLEQNTRDYLRAVEGSVLPKTVQGYLNGIENASRLVEVHSALMGFDDAKAKETFSPSQDAQDQESGPWSAGSSFFLCQVGEEEVFQGLVPFLSTELAGSGVRSAADFLNAGTIAIEDSCAAVLSQSQRAYYVLYRTGTEEEAMIRLGFWQPEEPEEHPEEEAAAADAEQEERPADVEEKMGVDVAKASASSTESPPGFPAAEAPRPGAAPGSLMLDYEFKLHWEKLQNLTVKPATSDLLLLYALGKQAKEGDATGKRPGMFEVKERAKYDAWMEKKGVTSATAKRQYVDVVKRLCASEGVR